MRGPDRLGALSGIVLVVLWAPMAVALPKLPDLDSNAQVATFWRHNAPLMQAVICSVSVGFLFLLLFLGALIHHLLDVGASPTMTWAAFGSALMFMTALNVALGLDIAGGLLLSTSVEGTYVLHTAGFLLAAPAAFAGATFFVAIAAPLGTYLAWILAVSVWWLRSGARRRQPVTTSDATREHLPPTTMTR